MFKISAKSDANVLLYSPSILNVTVTQYTCSLNSVYCPHWLVQWSRQCSHVHIPVHSPWLPGYIDATQTTVVILTVVAFSRQTSLYVFIHLSKPIEWTTRVSHINYELWVIMLMCQCKFIIYNKCTTRMKDTDNWGGCACVGVEGTWKTFVTQFCCESKTSLKNGQ